MFAALSLLILASPPTSSQMMREWVERWFAPHVNAVKMQKDNFVILILDPDTHEWGTDHIVLPTGREQMIVLLEMLARTSSGATLRVTVVPDDKRSTASSFFYSTIVDSSGHWRPPKGL
jgi:hypothetical protein